MAAKFREIVLGPSVMLPAMSTDQPEQPMSALEFLEGWVLTSPGLKGKDTLPHLFELEDAVEKVKAEAIKHSGSSLPTNIIFPTDPGESASAEAKEIYKKHVQNVVDSVNKLAKEHWLAVYAASVGMSFTISDEAFQASVTSIKSQLDELARPNPQNGGQPGINPFIERRILRLYHAFAQSREV